MQRVRIRRLIISLGLASLLSLLLLSGGAIAQNANGVAADKDWASGDLSVDASARTIKVTVNDPDINRSGEIVEGALVGDEVGKEPGGRPEDRVDNPYTTPGFGAGAETEASFYTNSYPIADSNGDGIVNAQDVTATIIVADKSPGIPGDQPEGLKVVSVDANNGAVTLRSTTTESAGKPFQLTFRAAVVNTTQSSDGNQSVVVRSSANSTGIELLLTERTASGDASRIVGEYSATFEVGETLPAGQTASGAYTTFNEVDLKVDLNGDEDMLDVSVAPGFYEGIYKSGALTVDFDDSTTTPSFVAVGSVALDETAAYKSVELKNGAQQVISAGEVDFDGDGKFTSTAVAVGFYEAVYKVDFNGDGDMEDGPIIQFDPALNPDHPTRPFLQVSKDDLVTITYNDLAYDKASGEIRRTGSRATDTVRIESTAPDFSNLEPVSGTNTTSRVPRLSADITDGGAGVSESTIKFEVNSWTDSNNDNKAQAIEVGGPVDNSPFSPTVGETYRVATSVISGGYRAAVTLPTQGTEVGLAWRVIAMDTAGNLLKSDVDASDAEVSYASLKIDNNAPTMDKVFTGHVWDTKIDGADKNNANASVRTSVRVVFNEALNPATVEPNDFRIAGLAPTTATTFGGNVYLTVPAQSPNARPDVELTGPVSDLSGNTLSAGTRKTAEDALKPAVTLVLDKTLTNGGVDVTITTDEDIAGAPRLEAQFTEVTGTPAVRVTGTQAVTGLSSPSARTWLTSVAKNQTGSNGKSGRINLIATAPDSAGNDGVAGKKAAADADAGAATGSITYELDLFVNGGPNGVTSVAPKFVISGDDANTDARETSQTNPFVRIEFDGEANEYDGDTNKMIILRSLTLTETPSGGTAGSPVDMMGKEIRRADNKFVLPLEGLTKASTYKIAVDAEDAAGNFYGSNDIQELSFKVIIRPKVGISLEPGMNLISFPEIPEEPGINEVFPASSDVNVVLAYNPALDVPWLISQRNADGVFGDDAEIQSVAVGRAYWVQTGSFSDLSYASRPFLESGMVPPPVPPVVPVLGGESNLIGFISLTGATSVDADDYFEGVNWQVAYSFDPSAGWTVARPNGDTTIDAKKGYIVFASADGWVTP